MKKPLIPRHVARQILALPGSSAAIAKLAAVDRAYVSRVLHGRKPASDKLLAAIHKYFETTSGRLMFELAAWSVSHGLERPERIRAIQRGDL